MLVKKINCNHKPVYYISTTLQDVECQYSPIEKLIFTLITAARNLRSYFQLYAIVVLTYCPLKQVFNSLEASGRMFKWVIELSQHVVEFHPHPAIKAQMLADFVVELMENSVDSSAPTWTLYVDSSTIS